MVPQNVPLTKYNQRTTEITGAPPAFTHAAWRGAQLRPENGSLLQVGAAGSKKLEYGPGTIYAGFPSSLGCGVGGQSYYDLLASAALGGSWDF